jgi:hypothetical protein
MKKTFAFIFHLFLLIPCLAGAQDYTLEIEGRYWQPRLNSVVDMLNGTIKSRVNLVKDLGFEEKKDSGEVRIHYRLSPNHKIHLSYLPLEWKSDALLQTTAQLNGEIFSVGTRVQSHLDLKFITLGYEWDFLVKDGGFLGLTFDIMILDLHTRFKEPEFSTEQKYDVTFPAPLPGLAGKWNVARWLSFGAKISGMYAGGLGHIVDAEAGIDLIPFKWAVVSAGYRFLELNGDYREYEGDYRLDGPFAALKLRW